MERTENQTTGKEQERKGPIPGGKYLYACALCHEKYEFTEDQHKKVTCCGLPVNKTEETFMSTPEPFGP